MRVSYRFGLLKAAKNNAHRIVLKFRSAGQTNARTVARAGDIVAYSDGNSIPNVVNSTSVPMIPVGQKWYLCKMMGRNIDEHTAIAPRLVASDLGIWIN
jgi:hypothetical protein